MGELPPYALGGDDGEALWFFGTLAIVKASTKQTGGRFALVEQLAPKGMATPLHVQPEDDESFYVLEGELTFYFGEATLSRPPRDRSCTSPRGPRTLSRWSPRRRGSSI